MTQRPFRYVKTSPEIIHLAKLMDMWFPLSHRNVEVLLHERGIDISHETVLFWKSPDIDTKFVNNFNVLVREGSTAALLHKSHEGFML